MAIILAYNIEPESNLEKNYNPKSQPPIPHSPAPARQYTSTHTHWAATATAHAPPEPAAVSQKTPSSIPQPTGWRILAQEPEPEMQVDAETLWNTQFNSRRSTTSAASSSTGSPRPNRRKRVGFAKELDIIPPVCKDLVLYKRDASVPPGREGVKWWMWILGLIVLEVLFLGGMRWRRSRWGAIEDGYRDNL